MKASSSTSSIKRWRTILDAAKVVYSGTSTFSEIVIKVDKSYIQINHSGSYHWTIRIPGTAKDGMRFGFDVDINVDDVAGLIIINNILALRYK